jgi:CDP-diacylglycerol--glycerol-3-phosphate 3-phosphatidyltransferase
MPHLKYHYTKYLPIIAKEVLGVYHCKFCIFDDKALITGANLSDEYFTNRQDRYHYFSTTNNNDNNNDNVIVNFLKDFTRLLEPQCNQVQSDGIIINSNGNDDDFKYNLNKLMIKYNRNDENTYNSNSNNLNRMTILPLIQHSKIGINDESELLPMIINAFTNTSQKLSMFIASPYISFMNVLISSFVKFMNSNSNKLTIIAPSPSSHGFHNAKGIKSIVPKLHMQSQKSIVDIMKANIFTGDQRNDDNFKLIEFNREQWTFHSKGIWIFNNDNKDNGNSNGRNEQVSHMSYIGSSNFGQRSWQRDFEIGFIIISQDNDDCNNLLDECKHLLKYTNNSNRDGNNNNENSSYLIKLIMKIFRSFL